MKGNRILASLRAKLAYGVTKCFSQWINKTMCQKQQGTTGLCFFDSTDVRGTEELNALTD